ncbi:MAG TPA: hypothetical protein VGQ83_08325 [Polyangia bacterium]|jgi:MYXO-CTERM domain-containing protein
MTNHTKRFAAAAVAILGLMCAREAGAQCIDLGAMGTAYTQDFDTLANTGTSSTLPPGWLLSEAGTSARKDGLYTAETGSSGTGDTYSLGATGSTDRALGSVASGTLQSTYGACFSNKTGTTISSLTITYTGEEWRLGATRTTAPLVDQLDFAYSTDATDLVTGTWTDLNALDLVTPNTAATVGVALDGNAAANRAVFTATFNVTLVDQATFYIRWTDPNILGTDDALAVDDFSLTPNATAAVDLLSFTGARTAAGVELAWQTGAELDCGIFTVGRCERSAGACDTLAAHADLDGVTVACHNDLAGGRYAVIDATAQAGAVYSYLLREHETTGGVTTHGPVIVADAPNAAPAAPAAGGFGANSAAQGCSAAGAGTGWTALFLLVAVIALRSRRRD